MARYAWTKADLVGASLVWILDLTYAGKTIRIAGYPVDVSSADGTLAYSGGLGAVRVTEGFDLFADEATGAQASLEVLFPVDVPDLVSSGYDLASATGELSQLRIGDAWENRRVVLVGRLVDPSHGRADEPVRFTLRTDVWEDSGQIPESGAVVQDGTFAGASAILADSDIGLVYPTIIGQPGIDTNPAGWITGSRALWGDRSYQHQRIILAGHRVAATRVWINSDDHTSGQYFAVSHGVDAAGREVAYISDASTESGTTPPPGLVLDGTQATSINVLFQPVRDTDAADLFVGWSQGAGLIGRNGAAIRGAGSVLEWALSRSSLPVDFGRTAAVSGYLDRFKIDASIDAFTSPMEWLRAHVLPLLPVSIVTGPEGLYPILWRYDATASDAVGHLDADTDPRITLGRIERDNSEIANDFTLSYGFSRRNENFAHRARLGPAFVQATNYPYTDIDVGYTGGTVNQRKFIRVVSLMSGPSGRCKVVTIDSTTDPPTVTDSAATRTVTVNHDGGVTTISAVETVLNTSTLVRCAPTGDSTNTMSVGGTFEMVLEDNATVADPYCSASVARLKSATDSGRRPAAIESEVIYDAATAYAILGWMARASAFAQVTIAATAPEAAWGWLDRGDILTVTDATQGIAADLAFVQEVERGDDGLIGLRLRIIEDPFRDPRA